MDNGVLVDYVDKLLLFSKNRTYSREEAEDLTQEILLQAAGNISSVRDADKFEAWIWGVANNTLSSFRRSKGKDRELYSREFDENGDEQAYFDEYPSASESLDQDEIYSILRRNIAYLSASYRDIIVMHYYDNLTCREIAEKLNIPEGTVSYRLSVGRNKLKKEYGIMNQTALKPTLLNLHTNGSYGGFPSMYINDALAKNILLQAYRQPKSAEEIAKILGVPSFYIEDRIEMLVKCDAAVKVTQTTIQANILICDESINEFDKAQSKAASDALSDVLLAKGNELAQKMNANDGEMCVYLSAAFDLLESKYGVNSSSYDISEKFDGWAWEYSMSTDGYSDVFYYNNRDAIDTAGGTFGHIVYVYPPFESRRAMKKAELAVCDKVVKGGDISDGEKEFAATAVKDGFLTKSGDKLSLNVPFMSADKYAQFRESVFEIFADVMGEYKNQVKLYEDGFVKLFPAQIKGKAAANCASFSSLFRKIIGEWAASGKVKINGTVCDILVEHNGGMFLK